MTSNRRTSPREVTHTRKGKQIIDLNTGVVEDHKYVNEAKRRSRALRAAGSNVRRLPRKDNDRAKTFDGNDPARFVKSRTGL